AVDQAWVDPVDGLEVETQALGHAGAEVLDQHVGVPDQCHQPVQAVRRLQVEHDAVLVAVVRGELGGVLTTGPFPAPHRVAGGRLDLGHLGTEVGEDLAGVRPGDVLTELDHAQPGERTSVGGVGDLLTHRPRTSSCSVRSSSGRASWTTTPLRRTTGWTGTA